MLISASILSIKDNIKEKIIMLNQTNINYIHLDIMDGLFVSNKTWFIDEVTPVTQMITKPLDIHLMVKDVIKHIDQYCILKPAYLTFHLEAVSDPVYVIEYLRNLNIKVGISIKPNTEVSALAPYLPLIDLVLLMSVEPGLGGQSFIPETEKKINELLGLRNENNDDFLIEVDGGINADTYQLCLKADMVVVGSYLTNSDNYQLQIDQMKHQN